MEGCDATITNVLLSVNKNLAVASHSVQNIAGHAKTECRLYTDDRAAEFAQQHIMQACLQHEF